MPFKDPDRKRAYGREQARLARLRDPAAAVESVLRTRDPVKHRARATLAYHKRMGHIEQRPCEVCGEERSQAHHDDYSKPLEVRWLCHLHHAQLHARAEAV